MTYEKFMKQVKEQILSYLPEEYANANIGLQEISKNSKQKSYALYIERPEDRIVPNIHIENLYQMHRNGWGMDKILDAIVHMLLEIIKENIHGQSFHARGYDSVKNNLYVTVLNKVNNQEYLKGIVHKDIPGTDITAVMHVLCEKDQENGIASFMLKESMLKMWGISEDGLYEQAIKNTERLFPAKMETLGTMLFGGETMQSKELQSHEEYVITNDVKVHGATAMLYPNLLQEIGEATKSNFFILPSSIHELILIKDIGEMSAEEFQRTVIEVNRTKVRPDEVLSDEVYSYDYRERKLTMATDPARTKEYVEQMTAESGYRDFEEEEDDWEMER